MLWCVMDLILGARDLLSDPPAIFLRPQARSSDPARQSLYLALVCTWS